MSGRVTIKDVEGGVGSTEEHRGAYNRNKKAMRYVRLGTNSNDEGPAQCLCDLVVGTSKRAVPHSLQIACASQLERLSLNIEFYIMIRGHIKYTSCGHFVSLY